MRKTRRSSRSPPVWAHTMVRTLCLWEAVLRPLHHRSQMLWRSPLQAMWHRYLGSNLDNRLRIEAMQGR